MLTRSAPVEAPIRKCLATIFLLALAPTVIAHKCSESACYVPDDCTKNSKLVPFTEDPDVPGSIKCVLMSIQQYTLPKWHIELRLMGSTATSEVALSLNTNKLFGCSRAAGTLKVIHHNDYSISATKTNLDANDMRCEFAVSTTQESVIKYSGNDLTFTFNGLEFSYADVDLLSGVNSKKACDPELLVYDEKLDLTELSVEPVQMPAIKCASEQFHTLGYFDDKSSSPVTISNIDCIEVNKPAIGSNSAQKLKLYNVTTADDTSFIIEKPTKVFCQAKTCSLCSYITECPASLPNCELPQLISPITGECAKLQCKDDFFQIDEGAPSVANPICIKDGDTTTWSIAGTSFDKAACIDKSTVAPKCPELKIRCDTDDCDGNLKNDVNVTCAGDSKLMVSNGNEAKDVSEWYVIDSLVCSANNTWLQETPSGSVILSTAHPSSAEVACYSGKKSEAAKSSGPPKLAIILIPVVIVIIIVVVAVFFWRRRKSRAAQGSAEKSQSQSQLGDEISDRIATEAGDGRRKRIRNLQTTTSTSDHDNMGLSEVEVKEKGVNDNSDPLQKATAKKNAIKKTIERTLDGSKNEFEYSQEDDDEGLIQKGAGSRIRSRKRTAKRRTPKQVTDSTNDQTPPKKGNRESVKRKLAEENNLVSESAYPTMADVESDWDSDKDEDDKKKKTSKNKISKSRTKKAEQKDSKSKTKSDNRPTSGKRGTDNTKTEEDLKRNKKNRSEQSEEENKNKKNIMKFDAGTTTTDEQKTDEQKKSVQRPKK